MKKYILIFCFIVELFEVTSAHDLPVHQFIVKQAYYLLENQNGPIPELRNRIGLDYSGFGDDDTPWSTGYIGVAAEREDREDPIWGFGGLFNGWTPSVTHFWDADNGDNGKLSIPGSPDAYNAYFKAKTYLFGGHNILYQTKGYDPNYGGIILGYIYSYSSLIELYKTGHCYSEGYVDLAGDIHSWAPEEIYMDLESARKMAAQILGRVAHLLTDMSVPAHAHNDIHPDGDTYEDYMSHHYANSFYELPFIEPIYWDATNALRQGPLLNVYQAVNTNDPVRRIRFLFYTLNQIADRFPSDDNSGDNVYSLSYNGDNYDVLNLIQEINHSYSAGSVQQYDLNKYAYRYCIRAVAGLFYWFAKETGMVPVNVPSDYSNLSDALNNSVAGQTVIVSGGTHYISGVATVPNGVTLEISPGAILLFNNNSRLVVNGKMIAQGTPTQRIVFDGLNQVWQNDWTDALIRVNGMNSNDFVTITNADIKNANCLVYANHPYGLSISNCNFSNFGLSPTGYALEVYDCKSVVNFINNTIMGNWPNEYDDIYDRGSGIIVDAQVALAGYGVNIEGNIITKCFKGIRVVNSYPLLQNNQVYNNAYGIDLNNSGMLTSSPRIVLNNIHTNAYYGMVFQNSSVYLSMNRIAENYIGMYLYASSPNFHNNLILNNSNQQIICEGFSQPVFGAIDQGLNKCGYNKISGSAWSTDLITASGNSFVELGIYDPGNEGNLRGYNSLIRKNPNGRHIFSTNSYVTAQFNYWSSPIVTSGNVDTYNQLDYDPTPFIQLPWSSIQTKGGSTEQAELSTDLNKNISTKSADSYFSSSLLNIVNAKFDSAMRRRSKEEVLLSLGASYNAKGMYGRAKDIFEGIVKGSKRTKFDTPALIQLYGAYQKELFDSSVTSVSKRVDVKDIFKQRLMNVGVYNSNRKINNITNLMLAREMMRFEQYDNAISAYDYVVEQSGFQQETKLSLYDLFTIYLKGKKDTLSALNYLNRLEKSFPDDKLISLAKAEIGISDKNNRGSLSKSQLISKIKPGNNKSTPESFDLTQNYPNPFNPTTTINYQLPEDAYVKLIIYDIHGREIASLHNGLNAAGYYESQWNGKTKDNFSVASGIYFYRLTAKSLVHSNTIFASTKKMLMIK